MIKNTYTISDTFKVEEFIAPFTDDFEEYIIQIAAKNLHKEGFENYVPDRSNPATLAFLFANKEFSSFYITYDCDLPQMFTGTRIVDYNNKIYATFFSRLFSVHGRVPNQVHHFEKLTELQCKFLKSCYYEKAYYCMNVNGRQFFRKYLDMHKERKYNEWKGYPITYIHNIKYEGERDFLYCNQHMYSVDLTKV